MASTDFTEGLFGPGEIDIENIFSGEDLEDIEETQETPEEEEEPEKKNNKQVTEEPHINPDEIFGDEEPESVGNEDDDNQEDPSSNEDGSSPNFYSSIANALVEEGVLSDYDPETLEKVEDAESFVELMEQHIKAKIDERVKRADQALTAGVEPTDVQKYENALRYLDSITEDFLDAEGDKNDQVRKELIYRDYINKGFSDIKARKLTEDSFKLGNDIEDAKEALANNKKFFGDAYNALIKDAEEKKENDRKEKLKQAEQLKTSILEDSKAYEDMEVDKVTRRKIYDNISKPIWKDPSSGEVLTAIQKYERENHLDFLRNVSMAFTLTDGFKNWSSFIKGPVKKEVKKGMKALEKTLNNTSRGSNGNLKFISSSKEDKDSYFGKGWTLDV